MTWTIPQTTPYLNVNPLLTVLTVATVLAMFYAVSIAIDLIQLHRQEKQIEAEEENE